MFPSSLVFSKGRPTTEPGRFNYSSARSVQASAGDPVAQGRVGKEGAGTHERIYKSRDSASSLFRSAESAAGTVGEEGGSRKGERQAAVTSAVQEPGYLFIRYLFSSSSPPKPFPSPLLFFFLFGRLKISGKREESCFRSFSLPHLLSSPTFPSSAFSSQLGEVLPGGRPDGV